MKSKEPGVLLHLLGVGGDDDLVGAEAQRVLLLARRGREHHYMRTEGSGELHAHVTQTAEADDTDLLALDVAPAPDRRVRRDPGAEQRRGSGRIEVGGDAQHELLIDDDALGVAAEGDAAEVLIRCVVGEGRVGTELLDVLLAVAAGVVRIDQATDPHEISRLELA